MKPHPKVIYAALSTITGEIILAGGKPLINTNKRELQDDANDVSSHFKIVKFVRAK